MFDTVVAIYRDLTGDYDTTIRPRTKIKNGLRLSSLGKAQFICAIEDRFDVEISIPELKAMKTVQDLVEFLEENAPSE